MRRDVVRGGELGGGEGDSAREGRHPGLAQPASAVDQTDQQQGHDEGQQRGLTAHYGGDGIQWQAGDLGERHDRCAHRAERDRRGVGDERDHRRAHRVEAERDQHHRADRDGRAEAREGFQERAEAEGDHERLDVWVVGQPAERAAQDVEVPGADGHPVHPQGVDDDPQDGEEAENGALGGAGERLADRHAVREPGDQRGRQKADEPGPVRLHANAAEQGQHDDQGQDGDEGGQAERVGDGFQFLDVHGRLPDSVMRKAISHGKRNSRVRDNFTSTGVRQPVRSGVRGRRAGTRGRTEKGRTPGR